MNYMDDYENAIAELKQAIDGDNTEALALLGMVVKHVRI